MTEILFTGTLNHNSKKKKKKKKCEQKLTEVTPYPSCKNAEFQVGRRKRDYFGIIFQITDKNICCDPSLEPSRRDGSTMGSQNMFSLRKIISILFLLPLLIWISESGGETGRSFQIGKLQIGSILGQESTKQIVQTKFCLVLISFSLFAVYCLFQRIIPTDDG